MGKNKTVNQKNQSMEDKTSESSNSKNGFNENGNSALQSGIGTNKGKK